MKKVSRFDRIRALPSLLTLAALFYLIAFTAPAEASWLFDIRALAERDDNVANTNSASGIEGDTAYIGGASVGYFEQIAVYTGVSLTLDAESRNNAEYDKLSKLSFGPSLSLNHKFGVGPQAVLMNIHASYTLNDFRDDYRDTDTAVAGISVSSWAMERLNILLGYEYDKSTPRNAFDVHCGSYGQSADCDPGAYSNPYDTSGNALFTRFSFLLTEADTLIFEYRFRRGQVAVDFKPGYGLRYSSAGLWYDPVFPGFVTARYDADTHSVNIGVSREVYRQFSLNLDYIRHSTSTSWANYDNNVFRLGVAYAF